MESAEAVSYHALGMLIRYIPARKSQATIIIPLDPYHLSQVNQQHLIFDIV